MTGGFAKGRRIVFLILATPGITIPVGFSFYAPDPEPAAWYGRKKEHPRKPPKNSNYPTKQEMAPNLSENFGDNFSGFGIRRITADALYHNGKFADESSSLFGGVRVVSQIKKNRNVVSGNKKMSVSEYFSKHPGVPRKIRIRGDDRITVAMGSASLRVCPHGKKRFVIAPEYEEEKDYRHLIAPDMSWRTQDIAEDCSLRWLAEVFIRDWKPYGGWDRMTRQTGGEGSERSLILSLPGDLCLFFYPRTADPARKQISRFYRGKPDRAHQKRKPAGVCQEVSVRRLRVRYELQQNNNKIKMLGFALLTSTYGTINVCCRLSHLRAASCGISGATALAICAIFMLNIRCFVNN